MAKALETQGSLRKGHFKLGLRGGKRGTVAQEVHDGDTVGLNTALNFSSRFLGIDAPEVSFTIGADKAFVKTGDARWDAFWTGGAWRNLPLKAALARHLAARIGNGRGVAANHDRHAQAARRELMRLVEADIAASARPREDFEFFLAFGYEFLDGYGRMLCFLNADRANFASPADADALSYNERLLASGAVLPYFIYPNLQPFLGGRPFDAAMLAPRAFWKSVRGAKRLQAARRAVAAARDAKLGVFSDSDPLVVLPYELRFLAREGSEGPDRWVIDLGAEGDATIRAPHLYFRIARVEDRLFVPREFVPLFEKNGWTAK